MVLHAQQPDPSQPDQALDRIFHALADPTRRAMLRSLAHGPRNIRELTQPFSLTFPAISKHVRVLESAGLVSRTVSGRSHICKLEAGPLAAAEAWLSFYESFWDKRFDALDVLLKAEPGPESPVKHKKHSAIKKEDSQ